MNRPVPTGKIPNHILATLISSIGTDDPTLLVPPGVGQDAAVVDSHLAECIVLKSDPITFATDRIGYYAVNVNANDIATSGATPRWFLATALFPPGVDEKMIENVFHDLADSCESLGITLCGGHTEITDSVTRSVISGTLIGTQKKANLIHKENISRDDRLIMTKSAGFEGTSVIARDFPELLLQHGMSEANISEAGRFLDQISVLDEARIATAHGRVSAMHDVTEGGVATALRELSTAGGNRLKIQTDRIRVHPLTKEICDICALNPLGLIGSGSLLIAVRPESEYVVLSQLRNSGIEATAIGTVLEEGKGIDACDETGAACLPSFATDEITRLFAQRIQQNAN